MVALITGADSGIGRAVVVLFAREGADVAAAYLDEHKDAEETKRAVEREGRRCILLPGDVADPGEPLPLDNGAIAFVTVHPSAVLRIKDEADKRRQYRSVVDDLRLASRAIKR